MNKSIKWLAPLTAFAMLAACSFSVGTPRNERVADAVKEAMEEQGHEVVEISFEEDDDDRNIYHGEATVKLANTEEEVTSECRVVVDEEQTISESQCRQLDDAIRANNLERVITEHYQGRNVETLEVSMNTAEDGSFSGYADVRDPQTGQPTRLNCTAQPSGDAGADWNCVQ